MAGAEDVAALLDGLLAVCSHHMLQQESAASAAEPKPSAPAAETSVSGGVEPTAPKAEPSSPTEETSVSGGVAAALEPAAPSQTLGDDGLDGYETSGVRSSSDSSDDDAAVDSWYAHQRSLAAFAHSSSSSHGDPPRPTPPWRQPAAVGGWTKPGLPPPPPPPPPGYTAPPRPGYTAQPRPGYTAPPQRKRWYQPGSLIDERGMRWKVSVDGHLFPATCEPHVREKRKLRRLKERARSASRGRLADSLEKPAERAARNICTSRERGRVPRAPWVPL